MSANIRKIVTVVGAPETLTEMGKPVSPPVRRAAAVAVIENPFAARYVEDLAPLIAMGEEFGKLLSERAVAALGIAGSGGPELRQGGARRRERRDGARRGAVAPQDGRAGA